MEIDGGYMCVDGDGASCRADDLDPSGKTRQWLFTFYRNAL